MKHNILRSKNLLLITILFLTNINLKILANENSGICFKYLAAAENKATYLNPQGDVIISQKAHVYGGRPVNTKKFKAPSLIEKLNAPGVAGSTITIDGFLHNNVYHKAIINLDPKAIKEVYVQTMPFPIVPGVMAGHVQARFVMQPGYEIQLLDPKTNQVVGTVNDMIVSYEAALPIDGSYNFALGTVDSSPLVGRLVSGQQKFSEGPDRIFKQYKLPLNGIEAAELLGFYINDSIEIQMNLFYNTIVRNCTTKIFDGLDTLKRFLNQIQNGKLSPFLTTIGGDPVIGPAINGLLDRFGQELVQVQNMTEEYNNIFEDFGVPQRIISQRFPFAPGGKDPMTILMMNRGTENLTAEEKAVVKAMIDDIVHDLPETMSVLMASAFSLVEDFEQSPKIIKAITDIISAKLRARLETLNTDLPNKAISLHIVLTPYPSNGVGTDLRTHGLRAQVPFHIKQIDLLPTNNDEILNEIEEGLADVDQHSTPEIYAFLKNFSVHVNLNKTQPNVQSQFLIGLQPISKPVEITNQQVQIQNAEIPNSKDYTPGFWSRFKNAFIQEQPQQPLVNMLLSHHQDLKDQTSNPIAQINFGAHFDINEVGVIEIPKVTENKFMCWSGTQPHTPLLSGVLASSPLDSSRWYNRLLNSLLSGRKVSLAITDLELNLQDLKIQSTQIRVGVLWLKCLNMDSVNQQFGNEANAKLQQLMDRIGPPTTVLP